MVQGALAQLLNIPENAGYLVQNVALNSPAQQAGLRPSSVPVQMLGREFALGGDIILSIDSVPISDPDFSETTAARLQTMAVGEGLTIEILRSGQRLELTYYKLR